MEKAKRYIPHASARKRPISRHVFITGAILFTVRSSARPSKSRSQPKPLLHSHSVELEVRLRCVDAYDRSCGVGECAISQRSGVSSSAPTATVIGMLAYGGLGSKEPKSMIVVEMIPGKCLIVGSDWTSNSLCSATTTLGRQIRQRQQDNGSRTSARA